MAEKFDSFEYMPLDENTKAMNNAWLAALQLVQAERAKRQAAQSAAPAGSNMNMGLVIGAAALIAIFALTRK